MRKRIVYNIIFKFLVIATCTSTFFYFGLLKYHLNIPEKSATIVKRQTHIFDNLCKFLWTEPLDSTLANRISYPKFVHCDQKNAQIFQRTPETGEFTLMHQKYSNNLNCTVSELIGGLYPAATSVKFSKNESFSPKIGERFWINANNFFITCSNQSSEIFNKQFMGFKLLNSTGLLKTVKIPEFKSSFARKYSISILVFDSTSRAQFSRHMLKTRQFLEEIGGIVFEAYNKVGDNSAVNMLPILASPLNETKDFPRLDSSGDINLNKILPFHTRLNPDSVQWIWKELSEDYVTMFNDDIMHTFRGLFHYPSTNFRMGFANSPTRFYYRPFYNHIYKQFNNFWKKCFDNRLVAEEFIDTWFRFENVFGNVPHFAFNFIASLTHDDPNNLNLLDEIVFKKLEFLNRTGKLSNTFLVIMGDHGNRVHPLNRKTFAGKIEERAPFLSITPPRSFRRDFPEKYRNLVDNSQRFISNFDLHETLRDILGLLKPEIQRGKSLFREQETSKTCQDNNVISNHCLCMVDGAQDIIEHPSVEKLTNTLQNYIKKSRLERCFLMDSVICDRNIKYLMPNNYVQVWARTKIKEEEVRRLKIRKSPVIYAHTFCSLNSSLRDPIELETQFRVVQHSQEIKIAFAPKIGVSPIRKCSYFTFPHDYCQCLGLL